MAQATSSLGVAVGLVIAALSALHVLWAAGARWGFASVIPEKDGAPLFRPSTVATLAVAVALALAAVLVVAGSLRVVGGGAGLVVRAGCFVVAAVFLLRAVGDFRYVGLFKRVRGTRFARWDTAVYSPMCLLLGVATLATAVGLP